MSAPRKTIALDFDGVLHGYSKGWHDGTCYDPPVPGAREAVRALAGGYRLVVSTCREDIDGIWAWLEEHGMADCIEDVTNAKPIATLYVDDRGLRFEGDWTATLARALALMGSGVSADSGPGHA